MTYLVVGRGSIGRRHAANLESLGAAVEHVGWRDAGAAGIADRLSRGDVAGLVVATATQVRLPLVEAAAAAGVALYIEKPVAFRTPDLAALMAAAAPVAARSLAGFMMRWHPAVRALAGEDLGAAYRFDLTVGHDVNAWRPEWHFAGSYAAAAEGGGVLLDLCHEIDAAACLFPGVALGAVASVGHADHPGVDMASRVTLTAPAGASGSVAMDYLAPRLIRRWTVASPDAVWDWNLASMDYRVVTAAGSKAYDHPMERNAMFMGAMADFMALAEGREGSGNPLLPRLDRVGESCRLIAQAWEARAFRGTVAKVLA